VKLNGNSIDRVWFRHDDIVNGGTLELRMGNTPGDVGTNPDSFPRSSARTLSDALTSQ